MSYPIVIVPARPVIVLRRHEHHETQPPRELTQEEKDHQREAAGYGMLGVGALLLIIVCAMIWETRSR